MPESYLLTELRSVCTGLEPKNFSAPWSILIAKVEYTSKIPGFSSQVNTTKYVPLRLALANHYTLYDIFKLVFINFRMTPLLWYFCAMNFWGVLTSVTDKDAKSWLLSAPRYVHRPVQRSHLQESARGLCFSWFFAFCMAEVFIPKSHQFASRLELVIKVLVPGFCTFYSASSQDEETFKIIIQF